MLTRASALEPARARPLRAGLLRAGLLRAGLPAARFLGARLPERGRPLPRVPRVEPADADVPLPLSRPGLSALVPLGETSRVTLYSAPTTLRVSSSASVESIVSLKLVLPFEQ